MINLLDGSNLVNISYFSFIRFLEDKNGKGYVPTILDIGFYIHLFFQKVKQFYEICPKNIFCLEGKNSTSWRKSIYPQYKANRHADENPQYKLIGKAYELSEELLSYLPGLVFSVENCEADDIIYALSKYLSMKGEKIKIVSTDKDLVQIMNYFENCSVYDPVKNEFRQRNKNILFEKAVCGDNSDNIKGVKGIGPKTLEKMLADNKVWSEVMTKHNGQEEYEKCMKIVDLKQFPYTKNIVKEYISKQWNEMNKEKLFNFFDKYNLVKCKEMVEQETLSRLAALNNTIGLL